MKTVFAVLGFAALVVGCAGTDRMPEDQPGAGTYAEADGGTTEVDAAPSAEERFAGQPDFYNDLDFFGLLTLGSHAIYDAHVSFADMAADSDVVVVGTVESVSEGRTIGAPAGDLDGHHTVVVAFDVTNSVKGPALDTVHVEVSVSRIVDATDLHQLRPSEPMLLFADLASRYPPSLEVFGEGKGVPEGHDLYVLFSLLGLVTDGLDFPLETDRRLWISSSYTTIEAVAEEIVDSSR